MADSTQLTLFPSLVGQRFGSRVVVDLAPRQKSRERAVVQCDCGKSDEIDVRRLLAGSAPRCRNCAAKSKPMLHGGYRDGKASPEYSSWRAMLKRTENPNHEAYERYAGRGIHVCPEWHDFKVFLRDVGPRPSLEYSLERIDNSLGYHPSNVKWATSAEQNNNTRSNRLLELNGRTQTLVQWARELGAIPETITQRLKHGWSVKRALTTPVRPIKRQVPQPPKSTTQTVPDIPTPM